MSTLKRQSPMDLRDGLEYESLEPYQSPRALFRQDRINEDQSVIANENGQLQQQLRDETKPSKRRWLTRLSTAKTHENFRERLSKRIGPLSSLDSTQSNSSMELDPTLVSTFASSEMNGQPSSTQLITPLISITSNDTATGGQTTQQTRDELVAPLAGTSRRRQEFFRNYYARPPPSELKAEYDDDVDEEDDDVFIDSPLPMPYASASKSRSSLARQTTNRTVSYPSTFEELLDDRQGMNNSEQQFTKGEKANRSSIDGSVISDSKLDGKSRFGNSKSSKKDKQRHNKLSRARRQSKRGFLSRFKLTKKHESIAKLQLSILNSGFVSLKTLDKDLQSFLPKDRLTVKDFQERVGLLRKFEVLSTIEYRFASKYETYVCKHAQQETNQAKNNYKKCIPYDYNRVVLKTLTNVPDSDYINASHVDSLLKPNAYIAAQGPNENTIEDFWRMVWEQKTFVIVMLTKVFDFIRVMCNQYWPLEVNKPERYGNVEVTLLYEEPLADFVIRTIKLTRIKSSPGNQEDKSGLEDNDAAKSNNGLEKSTQDQVDKDERRASATENESDLDNEAGFSDDTSDSEVLFVEETGDLDTSLRKLSVRSPKYVTAKSGQRGRSLSPRSHLSERHSISNPTKVVDQNLRQAPRSSVVADSYNNPERPPRVGDEDETRADHDKRSSQQANDFLHPLFNSTNIASSLNSLTSEPNTPLTPRTPSSAGIDRSSATRKAVKKKRRQRMKNQRPRRTQFMVPTESQLLDDDEEDEGGEAGKTGDLNKSNERIIYQFHYNSWASHTCPFISSLLHFRRRVRICMDEMAKSGKTGPTVVHCNDGCGRTGTYLCIDANLELAEEDNLLDVYNYTRKMRQSRKFLIENLEQYKFVYDTIDESLFCGRTWFPISDLHKRLKHKSQRNPLTKKNEYLVEYEKICQMTSKFSIGDCAGGHRVENREKNRDVSTVPPDNFRPYLTSFQTNDSTDFINAVFVDGYTRSKEYIVTEWPLHRTISDFWSLIYDHDCNSVILLANPTESSNYPSFLPSEKELRRKFGPVFSAEMVSYTHYQNIKSWIYTINKKIVSLTEVIAGVKSEAKTTQVFQITCWPQGYRVPTSTNALVELMNMVERWRQRTTYGPVCVVSLNGKSRAGVYCAANVAIEQVVQHSEVDVFNAVKTVRRHRPQLIENMTEYKYCYDLILHYVLHYVNNQSSANS